MALDRLKHWKVRDTKEGLLNQQQ